MKDDVDMFMLVDEGDGKYYIADPKGAAIVVFRNADDQVLRNARLIVNALNAYVFGMRSEKEEA